MECTKIKLSGKPNNLLGLQLLTLNGGEGCKHPIEGFKLHGEPIRVEAVESKAKEPLFHARALQELLRNQRGVDIASEPRRLRSGLFLQLLHTL